ncbi:Mediator complex subunit MED14 [Musa troglodytarum]|uniref:Mediator of RNA polymerase II transcription subunit 14 n=1 Tax=Musa troglodytarum TaxID=320322 RepID=A0A9E7GBQ4_9LILI|nr:Mediator complex subunit MED14 [Musa troglodytarum]
MAAELGQQTVEFSALVRRSAEDSYLALKQLVERSRAPEDQRSDSEKKIDLLKFIAKTRQRILRLHVLAKRCQQAPVDGRLLHFLIRDFFARMEMEADYIGLFLLASCFVNMFD